jgi:putative hemolysin
MWNRIALLCALAAGVSACKKSEAEPAPANPVTVRYAQTNCADPWATAASNPNTDEDFQAAVQQYVQQKGIKLYSVKVSTTATQGACRACTCPTGRSLEAKVEATDVAALKQVGFQQ